MTMCGGVLRQAQDERVVNFHNFEKALPHVPHLAGNIGSGYSVPARLTTPALRISGSIRQLQSGITVIYRTGILQEV